MVRIFDEDGIELDYNEVKGISVRCFMCENGLKEKGGILFSPPEKEYSDNVDIVQKYHICKKCCPVILDFMMGKINEVELPPKLNLILYALVQGKYKEARKQTEELLKLMVTKSQNNGSVKID